jgi:protein-S-isoprenylcysteine O-methyltransferase Ste14
MAGCFVSGSKSAFAHPWSSVARVTGSCGFTCRDDLLHTVSNAIIILGFYLLYQGWALIYHNEGKLVTEGVYSHIRHPQYAGLFLITLGLLIQWPTLITLLMWPTLTFAYYRLAMREEGEVSRRFPKEYAAYRRRVPAFVPRFS